MQKGSYCIIFNLKKEVKIRVKSGKEFNLPNGNYVYVGSAFNSGGIRSRVIRHLKKQKKAHWHLDFITTNDSFSPTKILIFPNQRIECSIASTISKVGKPVLGFGCSDCKCESHLFIINNINKVLKEIRKNYNNFKEIEAEEMWKLANS